MNGNGTRSPDAILESIQRTRTDMDSTLHAIEEKLTPGQMMDQGLNYLRNSGGREFLSNLSASVRTNPVPVVLVGIGIAWLMMTNQRDAGMAFGTESDRDSFGEGLRDRASDAVDSAKDTAADARDKLASAKDDVVDAVISARDGMAEKASSARDSMVDTASRARDSMVDTASRARDRMADTASRARDRMADTASRARAAWDRTSESTRVQMDRVRGSYRQILQEQPLALGAVGLGLGALLAAAAPRTRMEDETLGKVADRLKDQVAGAGREQMQRAREAAAEASEGDQLKPGRTATPERSQPARPDPDWPPTSNNEPTTRPLDE